jgi:hypothetical protein
MAAGWKVVFSSHAVAGIFFNGAVIALFKICAIFEGDHGLSSICTHLEK